MNPGLVTWIAPWISTRKTFNIEPGNATPGVDFLNAKYYCWVDLINASTAAEFDSLKIEGLTITVN